MLLLEEKERARFETPCFHSSLPLSISGYWAEAGVLRMGTGVGALGSSPPAHSLLLASHSLRSISRGSITSSLNSKSVILDLVCSGSRYTFFSSPAGFLPLGFALDFLPREKGLNGHHVLGLKECPAVINRMVAQVNGGCPSPWRELLLCQG